MLIARSRIRSIKCWRTPSGRLSQHSILGISRQRPFDPICCRDAWLPRRDTNTDFGWRRSSKRRTAGRLAAQGVCGARTAGLLGKTAGAFPTKRQPARSLHDQRRLGDPVCSTRKEAKGAAGAGAGIQRAPATHDGDWRRTRVRYPAVRAALSGPCTSNRSTALNEEFDSGDPRISRVGLRFEPIGNNSRIVGNSYLGITSELPVTRDQSGGDNNATSSWSHKQTKELVSPMAG
jgi:hypothetical protein